MFVETTSLNVFKLGMMIFRITQVEKSEGNSNVFIVRYWFLLYSIKHDDKYKRINNQRWFWPIEINQTRIKADTNRTPFGKMEDDTN